MYKLAYVSKTENEFKNRLARRTDLKVYKIYFYILH